MLSLSVGSNESIAFQTFLDGWRYDPRLGGRFITIAIPRVTPDQVFGRYNKIFGRQDSITLFSRASESASFNSLADTLGHKSSAPRTIDMDLFAVLTAPSVARVMLISLEDCPKM
jgi:hypothetical protein